MNDLGLSKIIQIAKKSKIGGIDREQCRTEIRIKNAKMPVEFMSHVGK